MLSRQTVIVAAALAALAISLGLQYGLHADSRHFGVAVYDMPLIAVLLAGGLSIVAELLSKLLRREFGADMLAGISIVTSIWLGEYLAGTLVVLMLSGGATLESFAMRRASNVLSALARRIPTVAHRRLDEQIEDVPLESVGIGNLLVVFPHEICPVDGAVVEGHGTMDESYLTGEPYLMSKAPGSGVLSGAINGDAALTIAAQKRAVDSRYASIMNVMRSSEQHRPQLRRIGDQLGALYTPFALGIALLAWFLSGDQVRFLAVLVIATPCPLLIAIPVAVIGSISLAARRGIVVKNPAVLEQLDRCRTAIFDKTGTLTYGKPALTEVLTAGSFRRNDVLQLVASLERYSKHPLSTAVLEAARQTGLPLLDVVEISEPPGAGLRGSVAGKVIEVTGRGKLVARDNAFQTQLPPVAGGLECIVLIDGLYAATLRFHDEPRLDAAKFVRHLNPKHGFSRTLLVSGDRESEVRYLAERMGIDEVYAGQSPEQKLDLVRLEMQRAKTVFMGDGINDAPALTAATVGIAFGVAQDITAEAADAVILDSSLRKVDEFLHIGHRMRVIALQSAIGGIMLSIAGMLLAATGNLTPVAGAIAQEAIDLLAVLNALRAAVPPRSLSDS